MTVLCVPKQYIIWASRKSCHHYTVPGIKDHNIGLLSRNICQDPLENYFGCQRQYGGTSDNPNALEFSRNTETLRVVNSFCREPVKRNFRGVRSTHRSQDNTPLTRRKKQTKRKTL